MIKVKKIINDPITSCCYVIDNGDGQCCIIDPGSERQDVILAFLAEKGIAPDYIILTHEHFDHCWGVNSLRKAFSNVKLVTSRACGDAIQNEKRNCSVFYDNSRAFTIEAPDLIIEELDNLLDWHSRKVQILSTPGHTPGSISIVIDKFLFSGDAYIPGFKTVTKLPGGNRQQASASEELIQLMINERSLILMPGH